MSTRSSEADNTVTVAMARALIMVFELLYKKMLEGRMGSGHTLRKCKTPHFGKSKRRALW
ncbi:hypothetical protein OB03_04830 [Brevundimonas sp. GN22]